MARSFSGVKMSIQLTLSFDFSASTWLRALNKHLESRWLVIMAYLKLIMLYFGVESGLVLG